MKRRFLALAAAAALLLGGCAAQAEQAWATPSLSAEASLLLLMLVWLARDSLSPLEAPMWLAPSFPSKNELGGGYGMGKASSIGKEWNEQAAALADYVACFMP